MSHDSTLSHDPEVADLVEPVEVDFDDDVAAAEAVDEDYDDDLDDDADIGPNRPSASLRQMLRGGGALTFSAIFHTVGVLLLGMMVIEEVAEQKVREIVASAVEERPEDELVEIELDQELEAVEEQSVAVMSSAPAVGAVGGVTGASDSPVLDDKVVQAFDAPQVSVDVPTLSMPSSKALIDAIPEGEFKGDPRAVVDDYNQAMDRITEEIMWMLDKSDVLLIWCFDQSESMEDDRDEIRARIEKVYSELGLSTRSENLMTGVCSYGAGFNINSGPTANRTEIRRAIASVQNDPSGKEMMCAAVTAAIRRYRPLAKGRRMALILVTDESGEPDSNQQYLEPAVAEAKAAACRIYCLGRESVFGYPYARIRWHHPQTKRTHWLTIDRGPETGFVEQLQTNGFRRRHDAFPSGFGPYEQCRMARETGGIFFMLPSLESALVRGEKRKYELEAMREYRPDLRARVEVLADRAKFPLRAVLWEIINKLNPYNKQSAQVIEMRHHYSLQPQKFLQEANREKGKATLFMQYMAQAQKVLEDNRYLRDQEADPRWRANYDLIYAQLIAYQARLYEYGAAVAEFIREPKTAPMTKPPNLTLTNWAISHHRNVRTQLSEPYIFKSTELFNQVIKDHPGTPWAARAEQEIRRGFGVELVPDYDAPYVKPSGPVMPVPKL